jgi:tape measure domain-containing protein
MSTIIEERITSMQFKGEQFLAGIDKSLQKLDQLNNKLKMTEGTKGFDGVGAAADRQSSALSRIASGVQHISDRFKAMGIVGMAALTNVTNQALFAGQRMIKSLTMDPILQGFREYELNMNSIQTILANTQAAGTKLSDVTAVLDELNHYSDQTIYNFSEMAKNIGTFTAAGVALKPAASAIKGIANLAALSGSNSEQASAAMYQLSQAISSGRVSLEDWNSVVNAGMGGTVFQRALAQTAEKIGTLDKGAVKLKGEMKNVSIEGKSFRESITAKPGQDSWLTSEVLTKTLAQFTGDLKDAELAAMGFNQAEIAAIQAQARTAKAAATEVKTLTQLLGTLKESAGSGWAQTWKTIFGDFPEAKKLFSGINEAVGGFISHSAEARNKVLKDWKELGGRTALIDGIAIAFNNLMDIVTPIGKAFRDIFPRTTGKQLADFSKAFRDFMASARLGEGTMDNIRRTFKGVFAVLGIGLDVIKQVIGMVARLAGVAFDGSGGFLEFTARIGDFLVNLRQAIKDGKGLENFFGGLGAILAIPIKLLQKLGGFFSALFKDVDGSAAIDAVQKISKALEPMGRIGDFAKGFGKIDTVIANLTKKLFKLGDWVAEKFGPLGEQIAGMFAGINWDTVFKGINTGLFAGLILMIQRFLGGASGGGLLDGISDAIEGLTGALKGMQNALNATALLAIALAIGILAVSMNVLAKIDAAGLSRGTAAMAGLFTQLTAAMLLLTKFTTFKGAAKLPFIAASMILMGAAIYILAAAMQKLAELDWESLTKGLVGVTALMTIMVATTRLMPNGASFIAASIGIVIMAAGIKILASAVSDLGGMSWEDMSRGLVGVGLLMGALVAFANSTSFSAKGFISGAAVLVMALGIKTLASAVQDMAKLSWSDMAKGLAVMAGGLTLIAAALNLIPPTSLFSAAAVFIVAASLKMINEALQSGAGMSWEEIGKGMTVLAGSLAILAGGLYLMQGSLLGAAALVVAAVSLKMLVGVLKDMGGMSWESIGKGMVVLAGALLILSAALYLMQGAIVGAAALIVAAAALAILTPILVVLGAMSWESIIKGLVALAGVFLVLGLAALVLTPIIPSLFALAASVALIGAALLLAGAGIALAGIGLALLATGLAGIAVSGVAAATAIVGMLAVLVGGVPMLLKLIGDILVGLIELVIQVSPKFGEMVRVLLNKLIEVGTEVGPKFIELIFLLLTKLYDTLAQAVPRMADAGLRLLTGFLNAIASRIGGVVTAATNLIVALLNGITRNLPRIAAAGTRLITTFIQEIGKNALKIADAGMKMIVNFVNGLARSVRENSAAMRTAGKNLALAIIDGMTGGLASGVGKIASKAKEVAQGALNAAKNVLGISSPSKEFEKIGRYVNDGFRKGLDGNKGQIDAAFNSLKSQLSSAMKDSAKDVDSLEKKLKKLNSARRKDRDEIKKTKAALSQAKKEYAAEKRAYDQITKSLNAKHTQLGKLANQQDQISAKLEAANKSLEDAIKTRDDFNKQITEQYDDLPDVSGEDTTLASYVEDLRQQIAKTQEFATAIQKLRDLGLNDDLYKELLAKGPAALPFINDVLASGQDGVNALNELEGQLGSAAGGLGKAASTELYQAGVDAAQGLVDGLKKQHAEIEKQMDLIADSMIKAIKKALGIKSPSREFMQISKFSIEGLIRGFEDASPGIWRASAKVGDEALESLRASLSHVPDILSEIDAQPTIRPVLDLSDVRKGAAFLNGMMPGSHRISVGAAYSNAKEASAGYKANQDAFSTGFVAHHTEVNYTQNNTSPKALSSAEIYRQTSNQLSKAKGALTP